MRHLSARCLLLLVVAVYTLDIYITATINTGTILAAYKVTGCLRRFLNVQC